MKEVKEVERVARVGEYIKLIHAPFSFNEVGEVLKVDGVFDELVYVLGKNNPHCRYMGDNSRWYYESRHYVVLENFDQPISHKQLKVKEIQFPKFEDWYKGDMESRNFEMSIGLYSIRIAVTSWNMRSTEIVLEAAIADRYNGSATNVYSDKIVHYIKGAKYSDITTIRKWYDDVTKKLNEDFARHIEETYLLNCGSNTLKIIRDELPCAIDTPLFELQTYYKDINLWCVQEGHCSMLQQKADKSWKIRFSYNHGSCHDVTLNDFGKTIFTDKREAEAKLKECLNCEKLKQQKEEK